MPEKTCPPHEWELECNDSYKPFGTCLYCDKLMSQKEIERRLNEHERLAIGEEIKCEDPTCDAPAIYDAWFRVRDGFGIPTGLIQ